MEYGYNAISTEADALKSTHNTIFKIYHGAVAHGQQFTTPTMKQREDPVGKTVKRFLASHGSPGSSSRASVVFDDLSVEGSGCGVGIRNRWVHVQHGSQGLM